jgi:hypothetical protein
MHLQVKPSIRVRVSVKVTLVPGKLAVIALYPAMWLKRVLFPLLGWPAKAMVIPSVASTKT